MASKPLRFSPITIWGEKISPEELEEWILYVQYLKYEALKNSGIQVSVDDIRLNLHLAYTKFDYYPNGTISVETIPPVGNASFYCLALFSKAPDAKETFDEYALNHTADVIYEKDNSLLIKKAINIV